MGVYVLRGDKLVLGPFQGKPACVRIPVDSGVYCTAAAQLQTQRIADVHSFAGNIACDADSRSELFVPLIVCDQTIGAPDINSASLQRFNADEQVGVEQLCAYFCELLGRSTANNAAFI